MLFALQAARGGPESVNLAGRASLGLGEEARGTVGRDEPGASKSGGVSLLLSLGKRAACCPPREAGCSLAQTRSNGAAAESSSSSQSQAQGWHKRAERVTLPVSSRAIAGMRSLRLGSGGMGGSGRLSRAGVVFLAGKCSARDRGGGKQAPARGLCCRERCRLLVCLPPGTAPARLWGVRLCREHPYSSIPARDPLGRTCRHPV